MQQAGHHSTRHYAEVYANQEIKYWEPVIFWIDQLSKCESVLDIGPAYGTLLLYAAKKFNPSSICAIDPVRYRSKQLIERYQIDFLNVDIERTESVPDAAEWGCGYNLLRRLARYSKI